MKHAVQEGEDGEHYLGQEEFINAIAPRTEDYVSGVFLPLRQYKSRISAVLLVFVTSLTVYFCSTKSSEHNMAFSSRSPIQRGKAGSH